METYSVYYMYTNGENIQHDFCLFERKIEINVICFALFCVLFVLVELDSIVSITKIEYKLMKCDPWSVAYDL